MTMTLLTGTTLKDACNAHQDRFTVPYLTSWILRNATVWLLHFHDQGRKLGMPIRFDNSYAQMPDRFFERVMPARYPKARLLRVNAALAEELGMDPDWLETRQGAAFLAGNEMADGAEPIAQAYAGHQFGGWVPQLGDGRAILLGEVIDREGRRRDIQLKGAGRTPWSRGGDGKSPLGPVLREYIVSEAMVALGVPATRALGAVATGEEVQREGPEPGGVLTRVAASHIRVGTFQYFHARDDREGLRLLGEHVIARHYPELMGQEQPWMALLEAVLKRQAALVAKWMQLGFVHGVMNTDNMAVSGETIDFGPCAFLDTFSFGKVFSSIDRGGRYAWDQQPLMAHWNLVRFAETLLPLLTSVDEEKVEAAEAVLGGFENHFQDAYYRGFADKLGLKRVDSGTGLWIRSTLELLEREKVDFTRFFTGLCEFAHGEEDGLRAEFSVEDKLDAWLVEWKALTGDDPDLRRLAACNPRRIPRNHRVEEVIVAAAAQNFTPFHWLVDGLQRPFENDPRFTDLECAPRPDQCVSRTFCGT